MANSSRFLVHNGVLISPPSGVPPVSTFLQSHPGAYTTSRTHSNASFLLFWDRHLLRLAQSTSILAQSIPELFFPGKESPQFQFPSASSCDSAIRPLIAESLQAGLPLALKERCGSRDEEVAVTVLVCGSSGNSVRFFDVFMHLAAYVPPMFGEKENGASLALVGPGREIAMAKFSDWVRVRKCLEKLRPPLVTELLLSNDGDQILEGSITNFFVVCRRDLNGAMDDPHDPRSSNSIEVQTAPLSDDVLPGVVRQLIIEVCSSRGIPLREVTPSWSDRELWEEAFVTNGLRLIQHVEKIQAPSSWISLQSKTWNDVSWLEKRFEGPGPITTEIQREITKRAWIEGYPLNFL